MLMVFFITPKGFLSSYRFATQPLRSLGRDGLAPCPLRCLAALGDLLAGRERPGQALYAVASLHSSARPTPPLKFPLSFAPTQGPGGRSPSPSILFPLRSTRIDTPLRFVLTLSVRSGSLRLIRTALGLGASLGGNTGGLAGLSPLCRVLTVATETEPGTGSVNRCRITLCSGSSPEIPTA